MHKTIDDSVFTSDDAQDRIMEIITPMVEFVCFCFAIIYLLALITWLPPFIAARTVDVCVLSLLTRFFFSFPAEQVTFLNSVVMPDPNLDSDSDSGEDGEEEEGGDESTEER